MLLTTFISYFKYYISSLFKVGAVLYHNKWIKTRIFRLIYFVGTPGAKENIEMHYIWNTLMKTYPEYILVSLDPEFFWHQLLYLSSVSSAEETDFQIQLSVSRPISK